MVKPWADQPFGLLATPNEPEGVSILAPLRLVFPYFTSHDANSLQISAPTVQVATDMTMAHNLFIRGLNAVYLQAPHVKEPADINDLLLVAKVWYDGIHHHHSTEEEFIFPDFEKYTGEKGIMEVNVAQHKAFDSGLEAYYKYASEATPETYDGYEFRKIIDSFAPVLIKHLTEEIDTLLALDKYGGEGLLKTYEETASKILGRVKDKVRAFFFIYGEKCIDMDAASHVARWSSYE